MIRTYRVSVALCLAASPIIAEVISDEGAKITVGLYSQVRADVSRGTTNSTAAGTAVYSPSENALGQPDTADFYFRRFRPCIKGTFGDGFLFNATLAADNLGRNSASTTNVSLFEGYSGKKFVDGDLTHTLTIGKRTAWFYTGNAISTSALLPSQRAGSPGSAVNGTGITYKLDAPVVRFGFDIMNNTGTGVKPANASGASYGAADDTGSATNADGEGLWYSGRVEITGDGDWASPWQESFAGKAGHGFVIGLEAGAVNRDRYSVNAAATPVVPGGSASARIYAIEGMLHVDGLTAVVDARTQKTSINPDGGNGYDSESRSWTVQAGYALASGLPLIGVVEPALRLARIDNDVASDEMTTDGKTLFGSGDCSNSGRQFEVGVNGYINGHRNKISLDWIHWRSESLGSDSGTYATADVVRLQHQLNF